MCAGASWLVVEAQRSQSAVRSLEQFPISIRLVNALLAYQQYILKTFWPSGLHVQYSYRIPESWIPVACSCAVLAGATAAAVMIASKKPAVLTGWLWFLGTLVPMIGLIQVGYHPYADRYTYLPLIGLFIAAAWLLPPKPPVREKLRREVALTSVIIAYSIVTAFQVGTWRNTETLFHHAISIDPNHEAANMVLGLAALERGEKDIAQFHLRNSLVSEMRHAEQRIRYSGQAEIPLELRREWVLNYLIIAKVELERGDVEGAERDLREALRLDPESQEVQRMLEALRR
jgi:hypothetical protein